MKRIYYRFGLGSIGFFIEADDGEQAIEKARQLVGLEQEKKVRFLGTEWR